jgi:hypothetical protein
MGKMGSPVAFVLDPCRNKRKKSSVSILPQKSTLFRSLLYLQAHLQHKIDVQWQMTFFVSNNNGNGIIRITWL